MNRSVQLAIAAAAMASLLATQANSGAFQLNERSAAAQGASFAGAASAASDVTFASFNPAALTTVESFEFGGNFSVIAPKSDGTIRTGPFAGTELDADRTGLVPSVAVGYRLTDDLVVGLTTYVPFGLKTGYPSSSPVRADGIDSELLSVSISPAVSYDLLDNLTIGAAFNVLYADAKLTSAAVELEGDDIGYGFSVGLLYEPVPGTRIGAAYHHGYDLTVKTDSFGGAPGEVDASLPNWVQVGITQEVTDDLRLMAEGRWINWSKFDSIDISTPGAPAPFPTSASDPQNYRDAFFVAVGAEYDVSDRFTVRGGVAWDETPTSDAFRTVRVPDEDRLWLSVGASYAVTDSITVDAAYSYLRALRDADVTLRNGPLAGTEIEYEGGAHILSVGATFRF